MKGLDEQPAPPPPPQPGGLAGGSNLDQLMPVLLFIGFYNLVDIKAAVVAATAWSIKAAVGRRRNGLAIGWWLPVVTVYLIVRSVVTILVDEEILDFGVSPEAVYFGIGISTKIIIGTVVLGTILAGRPLLAWAIPKVVKLNDELLGEPRFARTMTVATFMIVVWEYGSSAWDIWLYNNSGLGFFFLTRSGVNFIVSFACITGALMYIDRTLDPIPDYPGLTHVLEQSGRLKT
mgnify:CR=1 FL=1